MTEDEIANRLDDIYIFNLIGAKGFLEKLRSIGLRVIEDQPDHIIEFRRRNGGTEWQIMHDIDCRIGGKLLDCNIHQAVLDSSHMFPVLGITPARYKVWLNDEGVPEYETLDG